MESYAGVYEQRGTRFEILIKQGKLLLKQGSNEMPVRKVGENRFSASPPDNAAPLEFAIVPGAGQKAEYLQIGLRAAKRVRN